MITHPRHLRLEVQVPWREEAPDVEPVPLPVLEARALVVQGVLGFGVWCLEGMGGWLRKASD